MVYHRSEPGGRRPRDEDESDGSKESYSRHQDRRDTHRHQRDERSHYDREPSRYEREERRDYRRQEPNTKQNVFQNDGSFLEMFKKMQERTAEPAVEVKTEEQAGPSTGPSVSTSGAVVDEAAPKTRKIPMVGKRRGGRVLKTGIVKKLKVATPEDDGPKNAWSMYMSEVKKYKEASCEEEGKTRPLVK